MPCETVTQTLPLLEMFRERTLATLKALEALPDPAAALGWRPGPGRAHIAWQVMHIAVTEELFATERFLGTPAGYADLLPRFRGGSTPDDNIPSLPQLREVLAGSRQHLVATMQGFTEADLEIVPAALKERGLTIRQGLRILLWHEAHHQGQAHITLNLFKART